MKFLRIVPTSAVPRIIWEVVAVVAGPEKNRQCELHDFLSGLPAKYTSSRDGLLATLRMVAAQEPGPTKLSDAISHSVDDKNAIFEFIKGDIRVLWFYGDRKVVVCACGFIKKGQKTPRKMIKQAITTQSAYEADQPHANENILDDLDDEK